MTQPCHKDTPLNQQCCDNGHTRVAREESNRTQFTPTQHTPRHSQAHTTTLPHPQHTTQRGSTTMQGEARQHKVPNQFEDGAPQHTPLPPFNGTTMQTGGGHQHTDGGSPPYARPSLTMPPTSPCHPPPNDSPTHHHNEGGSNRRIPHHTNSTQTHRHTHHPHTTRPSKEQCTT